jgi:DNA polymerase-3 subunit epsilon
MDKLFYYDLETTGLNHWRHGIHQISAIVEIDGSIKEKINFHVQPYKDAKIEDDALAISGITQDMLKDYKPFKETYKDLSFILSKYCNKYNKADKFHLVGYNNASFDNHFFRAFFVQNEDKYFNSWFWIDTIDVMTLASNHLRKIRSTLPDFKLSTIAKQLGIEVDDAKLHDGFYDINLTREVFKKL